MYYIKVWETNTCKECKIKTYVDIDSISIRQEQIMICSYTGNTINENTLDKDCPIKELKPKQLIWKEYNIRKHLVSFNVNPNKTCRVHVANTPIGRAIIHELINARGILVEFDIITKFIFSAKELIESKKSVNNAKLFCEKYYNKLFQEMIGE